MYVFFDTQIVYHYIEWILDEINNQITKSANR